MKQIILSIGLLVGTITANAQLNLSEFNKERYRVNQTGFLVLSSWSVVNIASGAIGMSTTSGQAKYFHQMDLIWGAVNFVVAFPGYLGARKSNNDLSLAASVKGQAAVEKTFIFNAGLDVAYLAGGAWFLQKANSYSGDKYDKYKGYGKSILLQGSFLLLFDAVMFTTHNHHGKKLYKVLNTVQAGPNRLGLNIAI